MHISPISPSECPLSDGLCYSRHLTFPVEVNFGVFHVFVIVISVFGVVFCGFVVLFSVFPIVSCIFGAVIGDFWTCDLCFSCLVMSFKVDKV